MGSSTGSSWTPKDTSINVMNIRMIAFIIILPILVPVVAAISVLAVPVFFVVLMKEVYKGILKKKTFLINEGEKTINVNLN